MVCLRVWSRYLTSSACDFPRSSCSPVHFAHALEQVRVLKFFVAKLSMFIEERASVDSAAFWGDLPLGKVPRMTLHAVSHGVFPYFYFFQFSHRLVAQELPGNELPAIPTMRRASATGTGALQNSANHAAPFPAPSGLYSISASADQDALQPRAKKDKHATFTSPPPHLLPYAATPLRGSPSAAAGAGHSPSLLHHGVTQHQSLASKPDGSVKLGGGGSPSRKDMQAKIDVRM